jgi:competence protein ComEA
MDRKGYVNGRLDLDVATAAQIDSLPGVGPQLAKRIVLDRMQRGPFVNRDGLRRVSGVGPNLAQRIDSLVAFSGTVHWPEPGDTILPMRARRRP